MPVNILTRSAPASSGALPIGGQAFVAAMGVGGSLTQATLVRSIEDFEASYSTRTGPAIAVWDWLDAAFKEGLGQAWIGSYAAAGGYAAAFAMFDSDKGPGQVVVVGETPTAQIAADTVNEAIAKGRFPMIDVPEGATLAAIEAFGDGLPSTAGSEQQFMCVGPWLNYPPPSGITGGAERSIPASALLAGVCSRVEEDGNPNRAPGGRDYASQYADSPTLTSTDADRDAALVHHVNLVRVVNGAIQIDSAQTGVPQDPSTPFWQANCVRALMWLKWEAYKAGQNYYMKNIDAEGHLAGHLKNDLKVLCMRLYGVDGLFGATPAEAFDVNVGVSVNTAATAATATLKAVLQAKFSLYAKTVEVDLVTVPILGTVVPS